MSKSSLLSAAVVMAVLLGGGATNAPPSGAAPVAPQADIRYVDPVNGWSIDHPAGWQVDPSNPAFVEMYDPAKQVLVGVHVAPTALPLDAVVDSSMTHEEQYDRKQGLTFSVTSRQPTTLLDGTPAIDAMVEISPGGRAHQLFAVKNGKAFLVDAETYVTSWDRFSADFDRMLHSFTPPA